MKTSVQSTISAKVFMVLEEEEARALHAITLYGLDNFVKCFTEHLGKTYLEDHLQGLKSLFESIGPIKRELGKIDRARKEFGKT